MHPISAALAQSENAPPVPAADNPVLRFLTWCAEHFIGLFQAAGETFTSLVTGILPTLIVLLTLMYAITRWIGEERVTRAVKWSGRWAITRYTLMPVIAVILLTNPMCYSFGMYLPERQKPAFYDAAVSFVHPVTTFFPHANAGEIFVWAGVSAGVLQADPDKYALLALLYFLTGVAVILMRGMVTEWITRLLIRRQGLREVFAGFDAEHRSARGAAPSPKGGAAA
ncbi:MAG: PTS glucitol/sorbitol transporter subunit IIC [Pseudoclavibacter sp.]|nr:PTS glucitol/sorbitol transporter subunit IIC [Pseudoclavibacter sp.]